MPKQEHWIDINSNAPKKKGKVVELPPIDDDELNANWLHNDNWKKNNRTKGQEKNAD